MQTFRAKLIAVIAFAAGCGDIGESGDLPGGSAADRTDTTSVPLIAAPPAGTPSLLACPAKALRPGDTRGSLQHGGRTRSFLVHVPTGYDNTRPTPLVLNFHGATMTAALQQQTTGMNAKADQAGFVVVYPEGVDRTWNAGVCCGAVVSNNVDDVGFARALVAYMQGVVCVDPKRVYATGFSNGGRMSYRLGCEAADLFAAIAPVAGTKSFPDLKNTPGCKPSRPIPLLDIMGSRDSRLSAQAGQVAEWRKFNGCVDTQAKVTFRAGQHVCYGYQECDASAGVTYCVADGIGHAWPRSGLSANDRIWELFARSML
jgi:polyhydroxybutyrate depolymerase